MAQILIRRIDDEALTRLRSRAAREGHSLEEECRRSLLAAAHRPDLLRAVEEWRAAWPDEDPDPFGELRLPGTGRTVDLS
jgi:plasmid stability protein